MSKRMLVTGGAGFIGSNAALYFGKKGWDIWLLDNLSRRGTMVNLRSLQQEARVTFVHGDVRKRGDIEAAFHKAGTFDAVLHLAAQVAVTTSVTDPVSDFEINATGTFNALETVRRLSPQCRFIYASTNKVYGNLCHRDVSLQNGRYHLVGLVDGIDEEERLDFHSPYGCSKGAADQYVADYARIYNLPTFVIRQSCIYGERQFGVEDQGWVAWFTIAALVGRPITVYGDGKQVRDLLWVEDLLHLYDLCLEGGTPGSVYNAGGGAGNSISVNEVIDMIGSVLGRKIPYSVSDWRPGDQKVFISNNGKALTELGWKPTTSLEKGMRGLVSWVDKNAALVKECGL